MGDEEVDHPDLILSVLGDLSGELYSCWFYKLGAGIQNPDPEIKAVIDNIQ